ncbi:hypothetical protein GCM10011409_10640 [Lentibacillus populi]|uniref:Uncharacterized protein n=1 Tax=Lentibacillus populi TaxID=1827502 RepID=A0A9W5X4L3_9BACI|nr:MULTISPECIES: hypothetical protein [Bacillaceae]MBT2215260.1 hypothetical protein [Virgibacillus dakarensis]GGB35038.1 hypothetical protein GCM10011409_10640 [Lentibacillus populi]
MESFLHVLKDTEKKLGRQLQEREIEFLQWVYDRYTEEEQQKENICLS